MDNCGDEARLARVFVGELCERGVLGDVVDLFGLSRVRVCECCHCLLDEGWLYGDIEVYCSDECLHAVHPDVSGDEVYWTAWEG